MWRSRYRDIKRSATTSFLKSKIRKKTDDRIDCFLFLLHSPFI